MSVQRIHLDPDTPRGGPGQACLYADQFVETDYVPGWSDDALAPTATPVGVANYGCPLAPPHTYVPVPHCIPPMNAARGVVCAPMERLRCSDVTDDGGEVQRLALRRIVRTADSYGVYTHYKVEPTLEDFARVNRCMSVASQDVDASAEFNAMQQNSVSASARNRRAHTRVRGVGRSCLPSSAMSATRKCLSKIARYRRKKETRRELSTVTIWDYGNGVVEVQIARENSAL